MNKNISEVQNWLNARPIHDSPKWIKAPAERTFGTWEEWVSEGKKINGVEESLLWMLENESDSVTRSWVALALGFVGSDSSVSSLINVLESDEPLVQMEAAASLGRLGNPDAIEALCKAMRNQDSNVRANACIALGQLGGAKAIACLKDALNDKDAFVQAAAKEALQVHQ